MEKIQINNQIILMRKLVKQAKIHVIRKLVKAVKSVKKKKGDESQIAKYQRKASRLLQEIELIKKMNVDTVSKMALSNNKDWKYMISDKSASLEERAMARLISFDRVQKEMQLFFSNYPHLVNMLPDLIQYWEQKKTHHDPGATEVKAFKIKNSSKHIKKDLTQSDCEIEKPSVSEKLSLDTEENSGTRDISSLRHGVKNTKTSKEECISSCLRSPDEKSDSYSYNNHSNLPPSCEKENSVERNVSKKNKDYAGKRTSSSVSDNNYREKKFAGRSKYNHKFSKLPAAKKSSRIRSPDEKATVCGLSKNKTKKQDVSSHLRSTGINSGSFIVKNRKNKQHDLAKSNHDDKWTRRNAVPSNKTNRADKKSSVSLHPSWEAKRKLQFQTKTILPFQGKKVIFDD